MTARNVALAWPIAAIQLLVVAGCAAPAAGPAESGTFLVRLGTDTIAVERWTRTEDGFDAVTAYRTPTTTLRRYAVRLDEDGRPTGFAAGPADGELEEREIEPAGAIPMAGGFYAPFALAVAAAVRDPGAGQVQFLMGGTATPVEVLRPDDRTFEMTDQFDRPMRVRTDRQGRVATIEVEGDWTIERMDGLNFESLAEEFTARDARGEGLGPLSPRETVEAMVDGARLTVDYGSPAARGRTVFGGLVPYGGVWRTGANAATTLATDRLLEIGELRLAPGTYSLFTVPEPDGWELIVNRETEISGLDHDPDQDVGRIPMRVTELDEPVEFFTILIEEENGGGVLRMQWAHTQAAVDFRVQ